MHDKRGTSGLYIWYMPDEQKSRWIIGDDVFGTSGLAYIESFARTPCAIKSRSARAVWKVNVGTAESPEFIDDESVTLHCEGDKPFSPSRPRIKAQHVSLSSGLDMPLLGLRVVGSDDERVTRTTLLGAAVGYSLFDTSSDYVMTGRERQLGRQFESGKMVRDAIWLTTKLHSDHHGFKETLAAAERSMQALGTTYIDLYLMDGFKCTAAECAGTWKDSWRALEQLYSKGLVRALGVAGGTVAEVEELLAWATADVHVVQGGFNPWAEEKGMRDLCAAHAIHYQAHGILEAPSKALTDPTVASIARHLGKSSAQVMLRWALQSGVSVLFSSSHKQHLEENLHVYDFALSNEDMRKIDQLGDDGNVAAAATRSA
eukprot:g741.t1